MPLLFVILATAEPNRTGDWVIVAIPLLSIAISILVAGWLARSYMDRNYVTVQRYNDLKERLEQDLEHLRHRVVSDRELQGKLWSSMDRMIAAVEKALERRK